MICKIIRLFVNTLAPYDKYSLLNREYLMHPIHIQISQKKKTFSELLYAFPKSTLNLAHIRKKMALIANVFPKLRTSKNVVR